MYITCLPRCSRRFYSDATLRSRVSETLEALEKADSARLDGPLQRSLASTTSDGTARDAIVFDKAWAAPGWPGCQERVLLVCCLARDKLCRTGRLPAGVSPVHLGQLVMMPDAKSRPRVYC